MTLGRVTPALVENLARLHALERLRAALAERGIDVLYLKGAAFLDTLYEDLGSRPMVDLDLLVREPARPAAGTVLGALGYSRVDLPERPVTYREHFEWVFVSPEPLPVTVEVHVGLCQRRLYRVDGEGLWRRAVARETAHRPVPTLCPEDHLLHVALHAANHSFLIGPRPLEDISRILAVWGVDWSAVVPRARQWGVSAALYACLKAAAQHGAPVPGHVLVALRPRLLRRVPLERLARFAESDRVATWRRMRVKQALTMPLVVDRPQAFAVFLAEYGALRLRDAWARWRAGR